MEALASIVGAISGCISLLGIVYFFAVWRGKVDTDLNSFKQSIKNYPPAEMWTMVKTLWDVYVMDALRHRPDLANHGSSYKLKKEAEDLIPDQLKKALDNIPLNPAANTNQIASGWLVVKHLGLEQIQDMAEEKGLNVQEAIAILSTYLEERRETIDR